jgi:DNA repair exonuclease SbcCD ATPase subunit
MTEINDLFEQAATLCNDFAQEITEAVESVNEVKANAEKVSRQAAEGAAGLKKTIDAIEALMASCGEEMEQARQRADTGFDELIEKASTTGAEIKSLVAAVAKGTTDLEATKTELLASVQKQREAAAQDLEGRHEDLDHLAKTAQETYQQAETALATFRQDAAKAEQELDAKMREWQKAVDELALGAARGADDWVEHLEGLLKTSVGAMIKEGNEAVVKHNASMTALKNAYLTAAPGATDTSLEALVEQLNAVVDAVEACKAALPAKATEIATRVNTLVQLIDQANTAMNDADRL